VSSRKKLATLYAIGSAIVLAALAAVTVLVVRQQAAHARAVAEALHQEDVRTALWRMETRVSALLAMTTSRAALAPAIPGSYAANRIGGFENAITPAENPPQALQCELIDAADQAFVEACGTSLDPEGRAPAPPWQAAARSQRPDLADRGLQRSIDEYDRRDWSNQQSQVATQEAGVDELLIGPLASRWDRTGDELRLQFARRIQGPAGARHESYRLDWDELSQLLLAEIADLFPAARLEPVEATAAAEPDEERAMQLAAVPARLVVPPPRPAAGLPRGHVWTLGGAWLALLFALAAGGLALRASYAYGDKHRRFTHAVTHELRTPLTTFRMYSEMLARGMVPEGSRAEYLATLENESTRLARLVENVLRYARLEDGKQRAASERIGAADLIERCVPELARTCAAHGARLDVQDGAVGESSLETDPDAVLQILSNLVENACKYGRADGGAETPIVLRGSIAGGALALEVADEGPGVPAAVRASIFEPFERGGRDPSDRVPGVGLGLALSRQLAIELGGSLTLEPSTRGATFRLSLPVGSTREST
jgi:signal transduction histidine kinase